MTCDFKKCSSLLKKLSQQMKAKDYEAAKVTCHELCCELCCHDHDAVKGHGTALTLDALAAKCDQLAADCDHPTAGKRVGAEAVGFDWATIAMFVMQVLAALLKKEPAPTPQAGGGKGNEGRTAENLPEN